MHNCLKQKSSYLAIRHSISPCPPPVPEKPLSECPTPQIIDPKMYRERAHFSHYRDKGVLACLHELSIWNLQNPGILTLDAENVQELYKPAHSSTVICANECKQAHSRDFSLWRNTILLMKFKKIPTHQRTDTVHCGLRIKGSLFLITSCSLSTLVVETQKARRHLSPTCVVIAHLDFNLLGPSDNNLRDQD